MDAIDISVPLRPGMISWHDAPVRVERALSIAAGAPCNVTELAISVHTGTHVDAPFHFVDDGARLDEVPLDTWRGPALVVDACAAERHIGADLVRELVPPGTERVLFKTRNADLWDRDGFTPDFVCLDADGAAAIAERGVRLVGIDYLSVADEEGHRVLFRAGVVALEGLDLRRVEPGPYRLVCLPLHIPGCDGAPARALLEPL